MADEESTIAYFFYQSQRLLEIETYLTVAGDAVALAQDYLGTDAVPGRRQYLQTPTIYVEFDLAAGYGWELFPMDKVKITRTRAMSASGALAGVLFRVLTVTKRAADGTVGVKAILDSLTY